MDQIACPAAAASHITVLHARPDSMEKIAALHVCCIESLLMVNLVILLFRQVRHPLCGKILHWKQPVFSLSTWLVRSQLRKRMYVQRRCHNVMRFNNCVCLDTCGSSCIDGTCTGHNTCSVCATGFGGPNCETHRE